jgi:hypothetical protein
MKTIKKNRFTLLGIAVGGLIALAVALNALSQTGPPISITPLGTNQYSITITTNIGSATYDLMWTPFLENPDYPWTWAILGTPGQTNYLVNMNGVSDSGFFRTLLDTNSPALWELANPNIPSLGILTVTIDSPTNGTVLQ